MKYKFESDRVSQIQHYAVMHKWSVKKIETDSISLIKGCLKAILYPRGQVLLYKDLGFVGEYSWFNEFTDPKGYVKRFWHLTPESVEDVPNKFNSDQRRYIFNLVNILGFEEPKELYRHVLYTKLPSDTLLVFYPSGLMTIEKPNGKIYVGPWRLEAKDNIIVTLLMFGALC